MPTDFFSNRIDAELATRDGFSHDASYGALLQAGIHQEESWTRCVHLHACGLLGNSHPRGNVSVRHVAREATRILERAWELAVRYSYLIPE